MFMYCYYKQIIADTNLLYYSDGMSSSTTTEMDFDWIS
jgi:hypothetical protein